MAQLERDLRFSNELPVIHMWQTLEPRIEIVRRELALAPGEVYDSVRAEASKKRL
jgi:outer membrane protein assembly factor BamA